MNIAANLLNILTKFAINMKKTTKNFCKKSNTFDEIC